MNIYVLHKREIVVALAGFVCSFILLLFIGLAGPNVTKLDSTKASEIFAANNINSSLGSQLLPKGPFLLYPPAMSTYSQHLCLYITFYLNNEEASETFNKDFTVALRIDGNGNTKETLLNEEINLGGGRIHHLFCSLKRCSPIQVFHLEFLAYDKYDFEVSFRNLESVHSKYEISDIRFTFQSVNSSFTTLTIWLRFIFLAVAFSVTVWFLHSLHSHTVKEWSMEQKWTALLLPLLILYDNPLYPMMFLFDFSFPRLLEVIFKTVFYSGVLLFWIVFYHGIRQTNRTLGRFYLPKVMIVGSFFFSVCYVASWSRMSLLEKPTLDEEAAFQDSFMLSFCSFLFYTSVFAYVIYLLCLMLATFTELRSMQYFDVRIKLQTFFLTATTTVTMLVIAINIPGTAQLPSDSSVEESNEISRIHMLQLIPFTYESSSSASFLTLFAINNLYVFFSAYFYHPSKAAMLDSRIIRDDPTVSMMDDSDEEIIYAAEMEQQQPSNQIKLIDTQEDDESD
jgi:hypothetical protein